MSLLKPQITNLILAVLFLNNKSCGNFTFTKRIEHLFYHFYLECYNWIIKIKLYFWIQNISLILTKMLKIYHTLPWLKNEINTVLLFLIIQLLLMCKWTLWKCSVALDSYESVWISSPYTAKMFEYLPFFVFSFILYFSHCLSNDPLLQ